MLPSQFDWPPGENRGIEENAQGGVIYTPSPVQWATSDIAAHCDLLWMLAREDSVKSILEIGVRGGLSAKAFLMGLSQSGGGRYVGVDIEPVVLDWTPANVDITLLSPTDALKLTEKFDLLHIDGYHSYEQVLWDYIHYWEFLNPRAWVLFHDATCMKGVRDAVMKLRHEFVEFVVFPWCNGMAVARI